VNPEEWSEDGTQILVNISRHEGVRQLGLLSVGDGALRVIRTLPQPETYIWESTLSPDGRIVLYDWPTHPDGNERDVFVSRTDGRGHHVLVSHPADDRVLGWAPDGGHVLFASDRTGTMGAWLLAVDDGAAMGEPTLLKLDWWRAIPLGFDGEGSYFYGVDARGSDIYLAPFDLETGHLTEPPELLADRFTGGNHDPAWSPDGRYLAYMSDRSQLVRGMDPGALVIRSTEGEETRELHPGLSDASRLEWSPDGRSLLAMGADGDGRGLFQIDALSGERERVFEWPEDGRVWGSWGRNEGELVLFSLFFGEAELDRDRNRISLLDVESGEERTLAEGHVYWPGVSSDGRYLAFTRELGDSRGELVVIPVEGGAERRLVRIEQESPRSLYPIWDPDGSHVYYLRRGGSEEDAVAGLWRVAAAGGEPEKLGWAEDIHVHASLRTPLWFHPEGGLVALVRHSRGAEVWVMENIVAAASRSEGG
jgi:Tol biopolymer transport system component